jgi:hypothetical protein
MFILVLQFLQRVAVVAWDAQVQRDVVPAGYWNLDVVFTAEFEETICRLVLAVVDGPVVVGPEFDFVGSQIKGGFPGAVAGSKVMSWSLSQPLAVALPITPQVVLTASQVMAFRSALTR